MEDCVQQKVREMKLKLKLNVGRQEKNESPKADDMLEILCSVLNIM